MNLARPRGCKVSVAQTKQPSNCEVLSKKPKCPDITEQEGSVGISMKANKQSELGGLAVKARQKRVARILDNREIRPEAKVVDSEEVKCNRSDISVGMAKEASK